VKQVRDRFTHNDEVGCPAAADADVGDDDDEEVEAFCRFLRAGMPAPISGGIL